jgi:hypothetical protein
MCFLAASFLRSMEHLVEFPLEEGGSIVVEVDEPVSACTIHAARGETIAKAERDAGGGARQGLTYH